MVEHQYGSTRIEARPTRICTIGLSDQDPLLALGVTPIAVSEWYGNYPSATWPWARDELGDAKPVVLNDGKRNDDAPPYEELAGLDPDLIVSLYSGTTRDQYQRLTKIAPTVVPARGFGNFAVTWQQATLTAGAALGREADARALVDRLEADFDDAARQHPEFSGKRVVVGERFEAGETVVRSGNDVRAKFFDQLGFAVPSQVAGKKSNENGEIVVSDELMDALSQDLLVWNVGFDDTARATIEATALYPNLPVVKNDKVLWIEDEVISGAFTWGTVLSLRYALDQLLPKITDTLR